MHTTILWAVRLIKEGTSTFYDALPPFVDEYFCFFDSFVSGMVLCLVTCHLLSNKNVYWQTMASVVVEKTSSRTSKDTLILILLRFGS